LQNEQCEEVARLTERIPYKELNEAKVAEVGQRIYDVQTGIRVNQRKVDDKKQGSQEAYKKQVVQWAKADYIKAHKGEFEEYCKANPNIDPKVATTSFMSYMQRTVGAKAVADEMAESDFSEIKWSMEMDAMWYGSEDDAFFDFTSVSKNRRIKYPMLPDNLSNKVGNAKNVKIQPKQNGEVRILSADIALMSSRKHNNDATALFVNQLMPTKAGRYSNNIVYADSCEGLRTDDQALLIRKMYDEYQCDYIVLDCAGVGLGVYDCLAREIIDPESGEIYPALSCCNNSEMALRCTVAGADKVIWAIKATAQFNSDCAVLLREAFKSGRIRLLATEYDAETALKEIRGYSSLSLAEQSQFMSPYANTTLLIDELTKLQHEESSGKIKIFEKSGMRKDRYSSLSYNYYVATQIENKLQRRNNLNGGSSDLFIIKPPSTNRKAVSGLGGKTKHSSWRSISL